MARAIQAAPKRARKKPQQSEGEIEAPAPLVLLSKKRARKARHESDDESDGCAPPPKRRPKNLRPETLDEPQTRPAKRGRKNEKEILVINEELEDVEDEGMTETPPKEQYALRLFYPEMPSKHRYAKRILCLRSTSETTQTSASEYSKSRLPGDAQRFY
jgi:hypothetical protein